MKKCCKGGAEKNMKIGDSIGALYQREKDGVKEWYLCESPISKITTTRNGTKIHTRKHFYPLDMEDVESTTEIMEKAKDFIITREPMLLTEPIRQHCERWVEWANANPDKAVGLISGA